MTEDLSLISKWKSDTGQYYDPINKLHLPLFHEWVENAFRVFWEADINVHFKNGSIVFKEIDGETFCKIRSKNIVRLHDIIYSALLAYEDAKESVRIKEQKIDAIWRFL